MLDATDKCATVCHGMSKSLLLIVSTKIMKIEIIYLKKKGAERFKMDWDWCYAKGYDMGQSEQSLHIARNKSNRNTAIHIGFT